MRVLYRVDEADNLFPSIHCLTSAFCFIAVLADVIAGVALSELSWMFVEKSGFTRRYMDIISKMEIRMTRKRRLYE